MAKEELIPRLRKIANGPEFSSITGVCGQLLGTEYRHTLLAVCDGWPKFSGNRYYPVPHNRFDPDDAFGMVSDLWDITTEYGRNRRELALWFADYLGNEPCDDTEL